MKRWGKRPPASPATAAARRLRWLRGSKVCGVGSLVAVAGSGHVTTTSLTHIAAEPATQVNDRQARDCLPGIWQREMTDANRIGGTATFEHV